ncbi:MAG: arylesterase [Alphaproteobacteria bacterium]|nr:MAG: arylesterase [Alphaproteobacteria bacterium]
MKVTEAYNRLFTGAGVHAWVASVRIFSKNFADFGLTRIWLAILAVTFVSIMADFDTARAEERIKPTTQILLFGDSIAAGYGLPIEEGLAAQLQTALDVEGLAATVLPAGNSGDTTAAGLARLDWAIAGQHVDIMIVILGGNDALRAIPPEETRANLTALVKAAKARQIKVLLTGMRAPPNLGPEYAHDFEPIFGEVAAAEETAFYPFILDGVAADPTLNQEDGIHPNAQGAGIIAKGLAAHLVALIEKSSET